MTQSTTIGARLYATAWFAAAAVSVGIGALGAAATVDFYNFEASGILPETRRVWAETAVPQARILAPPDDFVFPTDNRTEEAKVAAEVRRIWAEIVVPQVETVVPPDDFVFPTDNRTEEAKTAVPQARTLAPPDDFVFEKPDMTVPNAVAAGAAAATAIVASVPILLLSLLRWIATGEWRFGFRL